MKILFLDDTKQKAPSRQGMGKLVGVGGVLIDADSLRQLDSDLGQVMYEAGFPDGEVFKWSPRRKDWMFNDLVGESRTQFVEAVLQKCVDSGARFVVSVVEEGKKFATKGVDNHETDALNLALERFDTSLFEENGMVFVAKPSGGRKDEEKLLAECIELRKTGTDFVAFDQIAMNVITIPFRLSRVMQCADIVAATTVAIVAGNDNFAKNHLETLKSGYLRNSVDQIGGTGVKIHPDYSYLNLYHWLFGDEIFKRSSKGITLPTAHRPFSESGCKR